MRELTRRELLIGAAAASLSAMLPKVSFATIPGEQRLIVVILRGGMDGLAACAPFADRSYQTTRGALALANPGSKDGVLPLDSFFGFHPALKELHALYQQKEVLAFHAVGLPERTRSHFDAQDLLENGSATAHGKNDGWLNRAVQLFAPGTNREPLAIAIGQSTPLVLRGDAAISSWSPAVLPKLDADLVARLQRVYANDAEFGRLFAQGLASDELAGDVLSSMDGRGRRNTFSPTAQIIAKFLLEKNGPRIAAVDIGGWDTHANQGTADGRLANNLSQLSSGIASLKSALGPVWKQTAVLVLTEFGRTAKANGTGGTDHGTAGLALLAGGNLNGGRVLTDWPGLAPNKLFEGRDLAATLDVRTVIHAVLADHLNLPSADITRFVLPGNPRHKLTDNLFKTV